MRYETTANEAGPGSGFGDSASAFALPCASAAGAEERAGGSWGLFVDHQVCDLEAGQTNGDDMSCHAVPMRQRNSCLGNAGIRSAQTSETRRRAGCFADPQATIRSWPETSSTAGISEHSFRLFKGIVRTSN